MAKELTRRELYELVWARPMTKVAANFGISDVALHKICKKHRVPAPGRGYWAKLGSGTRVKRTPLHELKDQELDNIRIEGGPLQSLPPSVIEARTRAKAAQAKIQRPEAAESNHAAYELHPHVERLKRKLDGRKAASDGLVRVAKSKLFSVAISPPVIPRLLSVLNHFVHEAEALGYHFEPGDQALLLRVDGEPLSMQLTEKMDQVRHEPTEAELKALQRWQAERERKLRLGQWTSEWDKPRISEWDSVPSGSMSFLLDEGHHWDGLRRRFSDGKRQRLEDMNAQILTASAMIAAARKTAREEAERRRLEWEEAAQRRKEAERWHMLEVKRLEFLKLQMRLSEEAGRIEAFVKDYTARHPPDTLPRSCRRFIEWAREHASVLRATIIPEKLAVTLDEHRLMDDSIEIGSWVKFE